MNALTYSFMRAELEKLAAPEKKDFWEYVDKGGKNACWSWTGGTNSDGYAVFRDGDTVELASRVAYRLLKGKMPPDSRVIAHSCDNPKCLNPAHAILTSQAKNLQDMHNKGRHPRN